jgi:hypothetical protein
MQTDGWIQLERELRSLSHSEDDSHEIIQVVVEYVDLPAKAPQVSEQLAGATFTGGRRPELATDIGK